MSTLARSNSHSSKKPQYKDYVSFLDSYNKTKKDDQHSIVTSDSGIGFSLNSSTNNSSSSVFSDVSDAAMRNGFKERLEHFNNNTLPPKPKHTVKTEMFIEIKNPSSCQRYPTKVFEIQKNDNHQESTMSVSNAAKIFEKKDQTDFHQKPKSSTVLLKPKQSSFAKKNSIGEISKKFEGKPPAKRSSSIGEMSKIFENGNVPQPNNTLRKPVQNFNAVPKPFHPTTLPKFSTEVKTTAKPAILSPKPVVCIPSFPKFTPEPPRSYTDSVDSALSSLSISPSPPQCASPPPEIFAAPPPPPPPMPPANFNAKASKSLHNVAENSSPKTANGAANQPIPVQAQNNDGVSPSNGTLDRNDPRVKKAVYGALRNMYGTYHDQANDYLATLPKNRVKKNNGLDNIINSIASQGGLDKLNGRVNPKQEVE